MAGGRLFAGAALAVGIGILSGCAGNAPFAFWPRGNAGGSMPQASQDGGTPDFSQQRYDELTSQFHTSPTTDALGQQSPYAAQNQKKSFTSSVSSAFKKATTSVSEALTIEPKVIPADDPVRLSSKPPALGADVYVKAAQLYENRGNPEAAIQQYRKALEITPNDVAALVSFARLHDRLGDFDKAVQLYERATKSDPENGMAHNDLGLCLARRGEVGRSIDELQRAVQLEPDRQLYRNNLATVLVDAGRTREAFEQLQAVNPPAVAHYNLGYLLQRRGADQEAIAHLRQAIQLDPQLAAARTMLARLQNQESAAAAEVAGRQAPPTPASPVSASLRSEQSLMTRVPPTSEGANPEPQPGFPATPAGGVRETGSDFQPSIRMYQGPPVRPGGGNAQIPPTPDSYAF